MQKNAFIITSTLNTVWGNINPLDRLYQTINTIDSIREKDNTAIIILVENSILDITVEETLKNKVDYFYNISNRSIVLEMNKYCMKGAGDLYTTLVGFDCIINNIPNVNRIFKISGRYRLSPEFNLEQYATVHGKFCFKKHDISKETNRYFFHTRLWSSCGSMINNTILFVQQSLRTHLNENITIEEAMYKNMNFSDLVEFDDLHCEGYLAQTNEFIKD